MKEPFINNMFPNNHTKPWKHNFEKRIENVSIFSHYEKTPNDSYGNECDYCGREECRGRECEEYEEDDPELLKIWENRKKNSEITLQDIINCLPEGVTPDQVKLSLNIDVGAFSVDGAEVNFYYAKEFPDDPEGFKKAEEEYDKNYQAYLVERAKYDQWKKEQEIKELEEKLDKLKK